MELLIIDIAISILQAICSGYIVFSCLRNKTENSKLKLILLIMLFSFVNTVFTNLFGNISVCVFVIHIISLLVMPIIYRNNKLDVIVSYTIIYSLMAIYSIVCANLFFGYLRYKIQTNNVELLQIVIVYIPQILLVYVCLANIKKFVHIYNLIISEKQYIITLIISSFVLDFIMSYYLIIYNEEDKLLKNITIILLSLCLILITIYFMRIQEKSEQIFELNEALRVKNDELRKIKHDYGAQISYLHGLCLMNRFDDLKESLKKIIDTNQNTPSAVAINETSNSLLTLALRPALDKGIHVIVKGDGNINSCRMPEMELYRVIANIVSNAVKAMNGEGILIVKVFEYIESLIIKIENNGPKIDEKCIEKIFESGFTTQNNTDKNHGFGLSIVKGLIENYDGKISVKSTDTSTEFKIVLPIK